MSRRMKRSLFVFGLGYTGSRIAASFASDGWKVAGSGSAGIAFDDEGAMMSAISGATHIISTVPPVDESDPVLTRYGGTLPGKWLGYLSSTGVYGDTGGAWVDENTPIRGRRAARNQADAAWTAFDARVFRLPGIYGPGRSAINRLALGTAHRVAEDTSIFSRVHVDDVARAVFAALSTGAPSGAYNIADNHPAPANLVIDYAASLLGVEAPPLIDLDQLSSTAREFHMESRRVANGKAQRVLGWRPLYPDFAAGLRALNASISPAKAKIPPAAANPVQR